jgi:hypothetical protein
MAINWGEVGLQILALIMVLVAAFFIRERPSFPNKRELSEHKLRYIGFILLFISVFVFLYASSQDLPIVFASWSIFLLAFATLLSVEQNQRSLRETRRDLNLAIIRSWAREGLKSLSNFEPGSLLKILSDIETDAFIAAVIARGINDSLESNVRAAVACCITLRIFIEQNTGLPAETKDKVDRLKQHLMTVVDLVSKQS